MATFAERAIWCRKNRELSQKQVSEKINVPQTTISAYERGVNDPKLSVVIAMADIYGVSLDFLTGRSNETSTPDGGFIRLGKTEH
jgi:transcriptional regulator with XRE-family HTH domain